jgi:hypothetical protein
MQPVCCTVPSSGPSHQAVVAIDDSKFKAVNNRDKNYTVTKVEKRTRLLRSARRPLQRRSFHGLGRTSPFRGEGRSGIGATLSLPRVPAKVPSRSDLPTFVIVRCQHAGGCGEEIELANDLDQRRTTLAGEQPEGLSRRWGAIGHRGHWEHRPGPPARPL